MGIDAANTLRNMQENSIEMARACGRTCGCATVPGRLAGFGALGYMKRLQLPPWQTFARVSPLPVNSVHRHDAPIAVAAIHLLLS